MRSASVIFMPCTEAITRLPLIITYMRLLRKNGGTKGYKRSTVIHAM